MMKKGVSEIVGYIYVFGIIMAVTAIVYLQVNNFIDQTQKNVLQQGIEQSFKRIQYTIYDVAFGNSYSKSIDVEVGEGSISVKNTGVIRLFFNYSLDSEPSQCPYPFTSKSINMTNGNIEPSPDGIYTNGGCIYNISLNSLVYEHRDQKVAFEAGGVFSKIGRHSTLLSDPKIMNVTLAQDRKVAILTIPEMSPEYSQAGGKLKITVKREASNVIFIDESASGSFDEFHIFITGTEFQDSWCDYFESQKIKTTFDKLWHSIVPDCKSGNVVHAYLKTSDVKEYLIAKKKIKLSTY